MNKLILCLAVCFILCGCQDNQSRQVLNSVQEIAEADTAFPKLIDGGTKIVYQFGHMTPDKGLKLYYDTIPNPAGGLRIDETVQRKLSGQ